MSFLRRLRPEYYESNISAHGDHLTDQDQQSIPNLNDLPAERRGSSFALYR